MNNSKALRCTATIALPDKEADFLSLNFILEMHWFLDNHSKMRGNANAAFCNRFAPLAPNSEGKFLVSSAAA
jgi:hypothetical protein